MDRLMNTVNFDAVPDKELSAMNGVYEIFATYGFDKDAEIRILKYLLERAEKGKEQ